MTYPTYLPRPLVLKAKRETVVLVAAATAFTLALSHVVHRHQGPAPTTQAAAVEKAWTGELADVALAEAAPVAAQPLTSASLVVPKSVLALPEPTLRPLVKLRGCGGQACTAKAASAPLPVRRDIGDEETETETTSVTVVARRAPPQHRKPSLMTRLNPLNHLPDASAIKRPFVFAGDTVTGWFKRF